MAKINGEKVFAALIDPDKLPAHEVHLKKQAFASTGIDLLLVGGSLVNQPKIDDLVLALKENFEQPVYLFPGSPVQFCHRADGLLFLSLISGRNADLLIGRHVEIAPTLKASTMEIVPTGYMLVNDGRATSASYISNTLPIPATKWDIALATAQAGELLGLQCIYMDAGSGADEHIPLKTIEKVAQGIDIPLIVGGGIKTAAQREAIWKAGADMVVVGSALE
ncbi:geranylgeranylglyceryl phosphate synthase family protein [bacterium]|nr:geranylgeranylglyceryl phosphate synthase family protein [bacterium]